MLRDHAWIVFVALGERDDQQVLDELDALLREVLPLPLILSKPGAGRVRDTLALHRRQLDHSLVVPQDLFVGHVFNNAAHFLDLDFQTIEESVLGQLSFVFFIGRTHRESWLLPIDEDLRALVMKLLRLYVELVRVVLHACYNVKLGEFL